MFENIDFEGNDNLAFYQESDNRGKPIVEFPVQMCKQIFVDDSHHGYNVEPSARPDFSRQCIRPSDLSNGVDESYPLSEDRCSESLSQKAKPLCEGEPYAAGFYDLHGGILARRRRVLFNLYAFDAHHSSASSGQRVPSLTIKGCKFSKFMSGQQESLIEVETANLYPVMPLTDKTKGFLKHLGADNGASIIIENSKFELSRFCKGLIVYREGVDY